MACDAALADLIDYVRQDGVRVAAFDATNSTKERRGHIMQRLKDAGLGAKRMFVESICDQEGVSYYETTREHFLISVERRIEIDYQPEVLTFPSLAPGTCLFLIAFG